MTSTNLLLQVRTALDEQSPAFWTDAEIYTFLTQAQHSVFGYLVDMYRMGKRTLSGNLSKILKKVDNTPIVITDTYLKPTGFWTPLDVMYTLDGETIPYQARIVNFVTKPTETNYWLNDPRVLSVTFYDTNFIFSSVVKSYSMQYFALPSSVTAGINPILLEDAESALIHYTLMWALSKDGKQNESGQHFQLFLKALDGVQ